MKTPTCVVCQDEPALPRPGSFGGYVELSTDMWGEFGHYRVDRTHVVCLGCALSNPAAIFSYHPRLTRC